MSVIDPVGYDPRVLPSWDAILFDLDGTIADSAGAITRSVVQALRAVGAPVPGQDELLAYVGPPLRVGLSRIARLDAADVDRAVVAYRQAYGEALLDTGVFDGVPDLLDALTSQGFPLAVATSKAEDYACRILEHLGLMGHFAVVAGACPDGRDGDKATVVRRAVRGLADRGHSTDRVVLVGDREHDVAGAARWGIPCILVGWGYGADEEADGAHAVVHTVTELAEALGAA